MRNFFKKLWRIITSPFRLIFWIFKQIWLFFKRIYLNIKNFFTEEPDDSPLGDVVQSVVEDPSGILYHLNELRKHIFRIIIVVLLCSAISFIFVNEIMDWIASPIGGISELQAIEVTEPIGIVMRTTFLTGFTVSLPYIVFELLLFAAPGISRKSRIIGLLSIPLVTAFFVGGLIFAYYLVVPVAMPVLLNFMEIPTLPTPSSYMKFVTGLMFWIGVCFEFPLLAYLLAAMRILKVEVLVKNWRLAVVVMSLAAAMITPTVDPINMAIVLIPLIILYGLGIIMALLAGGGKKRKEEVKKTE
jgi:sec-independent protein translocase protein TatC